jgi:polysaccharide biosynthesis/export protein
MGMRMMKGEGKMTRTMARAIAIAALLLALTTMGMAQTAAGSEPDVAPPLKIGSGDLLEVTMFLNPDLSGRYRVDEKGDIVLPLAGRIHVQGTTADETAALIEKRFLDGQILQPANCHATVFIAEYATQGITINGDVKTPGVYPALGVRMLNDVIAAAGGLTVTSASKVVITHRDDPEHPVTVDYNPAALKPVIPPVQIFPGDSLLIPRAGLVYVLGDVGKAGAYVLDGRDTLTVEEAMALAGGGAHAAQLKRVQLVRTMPDGKKEEIIIPVNLIFKGQAPDVAMKDGDILFVPTSNGKLIAEQAILSALSVGTSVAVYHAATQ